MECEVDTCSQNAVCKLRVPDWKSAGRIEREEMLLCEYHREGLITILNETSAEHDVMPPGTVLVEREFTL